MKITRKELELKIKNNENLSNLDVSGITSMNSIFAFSSFNGDISKWDVSKVTDMGNMFHQSKFNGDISKWDVSNVIDMTSMFYNSSFPKEVVDWDSYLLYTNYKINIGKKIGKFKDFLDL